MSDRGCEDAYVPDVIPEEDREYYRKGNMGHRIGWGEAPAVLVVDLTDEFTHDGHAAGRSDTGKRTLRATARLLDVARERDVWVIFTRPQRDFPEANSGTTKSFLGRDEPRDEGMNTIAERLDPREDEYVLTKPRASAFFDTHLSNMLRNHGVDTLLVAGMTTSGCVRSTVVDGHSSNFRMIVPEECVADRSEISHEVNLFDIDMKYADVTPLEDVLGTLETY